MANERSSQYKGCSITTRWAESQWPDDELTKRFTASFSVDSPEAHDSAWQQFPAAEFATPSRAVDNALEIAKKSIDRHIIDKPSSKQSRPAR